MDYLDKNLGITCKTNQKARKFKCYLHCIITRDNHQKTQSNCPKIEIRYEAAPADQITRAMSMRQRQSEVRQTTEMGDKMNCVYADQDMAAR